MNIEEIRNIAEELKSFPPGIVSIASSFLGRYREFDVCLHHLLMPPGSFVEWGLGVNIAYSFNQGIKAMLKESQFKWILFLGDDHNFGPDFLYRLLKHNVDVVAPLVLKRSIPFQTVLSLPVSEGCKAIPIEACKSWKGLLDISDFNIGNAGLLVKREVFELMPSPWFENGKINPEFGSCDIWFCEKLRKLGVKIFLDADIFMGHITHCFFCVTRDEQGNLLPDVRMVEAS